ncbi:MAG TPA: TlpA disulfide reductase family protein [Thermoanaerobaculia bacterium]|nr:TlpA disulfide reductase family protein [Thermoanaerobaculia bacterium]
MRRKAGIASLLFVLAACHHAEPPSAAGTWRAVLTSPGGELPFTLRIVRDGAALRAVIVNGSEQAPASSVDVHDASLTIRFDVYDSAINATFADGGNALTGAWTRTVPAGICRMAFRATRGEQPRFLPAASAGTASLGDVNGIWKAEFTDSDGVSPARGEFHQDPGSSRVTGTFLTPTGDDRYLEGSFEDGILRLSTFDGAHAFLFQARASRDGRLAGDYWSRDSYHATWTATRSDDAGATLPDGWKDVGLTNTEGRFRFSFPDLAGKPVALSDERFRGKVVLVNIFGSWCPNCNDEAPLLVAWDRTYRHRGLEIVGLAYEFTGNAARDREMVRRFANHYGITYPLLLAGVSDKRKASATLPDLTRVLAYPTSIFIGRDGNVKKIYSGFAGPGTGKHFDALRTEMETLIESMLAEGKR